MTTDRRGFDHLAKEISVAVGQRVPRWPLWLRLRERGRNPERLSREEAIAFCDEDLSGYLEEHALSLAPAARRRLQRAVRSFDPRHPTPEEVMARLAPRGR